jgi:Methylamine utilisation protein MauE
LLVFATAIAINLLRGRVFDCGCAGAAPRTIGWSHVAVNVALAGIAAIIAVAPPADLAVVPGPAAVFSVATPRSDALPIVLAVLLALVIANIAGKAATIRRLLAAVAAQEGPAAGPVDRGRH